MCESEPEKIDITISSTPAPIVKKIEICEEVFKGGSIPADKEPANNAEVNDNGERVILLLKLKIGYLIARVIKQIAVHILSKFLAYP